MKRLERNERKQQRKLIDNAMRAARANVDAMTESLRRERGDHGADIDDEPDFFARLA